ncbi:MAG TPA: TIGR03435 family protein [Thermoanaerobaculia bacterium]|nr:TIGR03435 family protein [Thermoanaerobaculia bacterium]
MTKALTPLLLAFYLARSVAAADAPKRVRVGDTAPPLAVEAVVQGGGPAELAPAALRGQAVVLEFWATWCGPCVAALPHWNGIAAELAGQPVRFVSITAEPEEKVLPFLAKHPIAGVVALDPDRSVFAAYGVRGIPHTVLIDAQGTVRAVTRPDDVDAAAIADLLAGKTPQVAAFVDPRDRFAELLGATGGPEPLLRALVRPSATPEEQTMAFGVGTFYGTAVDAKTALALAFGVAPTRVIAEAPLPEGLYDLAFAAPPDDEEALFSLLRQAVPAALGVVAGLEQRPLEVWLLTVPEGGKPTLVEGEGPLSFRADARKGTIRGQAMRGSSLAAALEKVLGRPVLDETGLAGRYAVELSWDAAKPEALPAALRAQLGLALVPARRQIEVLVVRARPQAVESTAAR